MGTAEVWGVRGGYAGGGANFSVSALLATSASGFLDLEREVIASWVVEGNGMSLAMHRHLGMCEVGRVRGRHVMKGRRCDRLLFDMTRAEFGERYPDVPSESGVTYRSLQQQF